VLRRLIAPFGWLDFGLVLFVAFQLLLLQGVGSIASYHSVLAVIGFLCFWGLLAYS